MITSHLNTYYFISTTITTTNQGLNSFKCMIRGASLTSPYTQLNTLSLPPVAPVFPLKSQSYHSKLPSYRWSYSAGILSTHRSCTTGTTNHTKMHDKLASIAGILLESYQPTDAT